MYSQLFEACLTLLFGRIRVIPVSESDVLFLLVEIWYSLLVGRVPSTLILSFVFREHHYLIVSRELVTTVSGNIFFSLC